MAKNQVFAKQNMVVFLKLHCFVGTTEYCESKQKRLKVFRLETVRAGFKKALQERDYATIMTVTNKIPYKVFRENPRPSCCTTRR
jgi:hypothetical protein